MKVRGVVNVDMSAHVVGNMGYLADDAVMLALRCLGGLEPGAIVVVNIGEAHYWPPRLMHFLREALVDAETVQVTGSDPRSVHRAVQELATGTEAWT